MNELALFAGAGGGILGSILNGWRTVCAVEINDYCRRVLMQRQDDGMLEPFPIWNDVTTFDGRPWAGCVDIVTGGFPCQDISAAGKGAGITGERSGLWSEMARIIGEVRPRYVLVENSPILSIRGLGTVLGDLAALGFDAEWGCISAAETGAPHKRDRMWIVADANRLRKPQSKRGQQNERRWSCDGCGWIFESNRITRFGCPQCGKQQPDVANSSCGWRQDDELRSGRHELGLCREELADTNCDTAQRLESESQPGGIRRQAGLLGRKGIFQPWPADPADAAESRVGRVAHGVAKRVDRLKAIGNGQVPRVVAAAWEILK